MLPSDGKRYVVLGAHYDAAHRNHRNTAGQKIPVIEALAPPDAGYIEDDTQSHDFAMLVLKFPAHFSSIGKNPSIFNQHILLFVLLQCQASACPILMRSFQARGQ